jgi:hypothetical protein
MGHCATPDIFRSQSKHRPIKMTVNWFTFRAFFTRFGGPRCLRLRLLTNPAGPAPTIGQRISRDGG